MRIYTQLKVTTLNQERRRATGPIHGKKAAQVFLERLFSFPTHLFAKLRPCYFLLFFFFKEMSMTLLLIFQCRHGVSKQAYLFVFMELICSHLDKSISFTEYFEELY